MNKYLKAITYIEKLTKDETDKIMLKCLLELADKATPKVFVDQFGVVKCGCCKEPITHPKYGTAKYCLHCGQKMWSNE